MSTALADICHELEIEIVDIRQSRSRRPGQTCAERTLLKILGDEGSAHLRSVLMSIMETENNKLMLVAPVIWAISDVLRGHPDWLGDTWFKALDKIDLAELYINAKKSREAVAPRQAIATMIIERLRPLFVDQPQARLL
jgi:hypothetical protein